MNRRDFVKWSGLLTAGAGLGALRVPALEVASSETADARWRSDLLAPIDLLERIRLGRSALLGILDGDRHHLPYWSCVIEQGDIKEFKHGPYDGEGVWDRMHNAGRVLHGLTMAEAITGEQTDPVIIADLTRYLVGLFSAGDGLPGDSDTKDGKRVVSLHNIREALNGLTALIRRGEPQAAPLAQQMVRRLRASLDDEGRLHPDRLPAYVGAYSSQPHMEGRAVDALVRYYRVSGDAVALETAGLITGFALRHCFTEAGALTPLAGTHGHSINVLVAGMIDYALEINDAALLAQARRAFDVGLAQFNSSFGWSMESLHRLVLRGEANNTGDFLRAALLLGRAGFPDYYGRAERILRAHLLPSQFCDIAGFSDDPHATEDRRRSLASRCRGGFGVPTPNDRQFTPDPIHVCDITSGALDALCEAWHAAAPTDAQEVRVNLLFSLEAPAVTVRSGLSREGRVEIAARDGRNIWVRIPAWASPGGVTVRIGATPVPTRFIGPYVFVAGADASQVVTVEFPVPEERTVETMVYQPFTIDWRGDQIVAMSPPATPNPQMAALPPRSMPMFPLCR